MIWFFGKSHGDAILLPHCTGISPLRLKLLTYFICGKSGAEADVPVDVRARVVQVDVEDAGRGAIVPVPATVGHTLHHVPFLWSDVLSEEYSSRIIPPICFPISPIFPDQIS